MRLRFILPELEAFIRLNPARYRADIHNDELKFPRSEQAADVSFGKRSDPCRSLQSIISPQFAERQVRHDLERGVHVAPTDLIVVQELNGERLARSWRKQCAVGKPLDSSGRNSSPETGSLHPMAIEVGCFSVTKAQFSSYFPATSRAAPVPLPGRERNPLFMPINGEPHPQRG
jgi:hypothetical protein